MRLYTEYKRVSVASTAGSEGPLETIEKQAHPIGSYVERLLKLIPGEVVIAYPFAMQVLAVEPHKTLGTSLAGLLAALLTVLVRVLMPRSHRPQWYAVCVSVVACIIWIYQQKGFLFVQVPTDWQGVPSLVLLVFVLLMPAILQGDKKYVD